MRYETLQNNLHSAITNEFHKFAEDLDPHDPRHAELSGMLQGFFLLTEWNGLDGSRKVDMIASEDARLWDIEGWIGFINKDLQAQHISNHVADIVEEVVHGHFEHFLKGDE